MGWVWRDDGDGADSISADVTKNDSQSDDRCSTRKVVKSQCKTQEVEPGKFIRKCEKTEEIFRSCIGKPSELVQSNKEYTEEDVTAEMQRGFVSPGSLDDGHFNFPGLRSDIDAIGQSLFGNIDRFFQEAEDMKNSFFKSIFDGFQSPDWDSSSSSSRRGIPIEGHPPTVTPSEPKYGQVDVNGLAREV
ncbi:fra a 1-associated protein [Punica granatum]|uniref:Uncharacterized protein n=2 Tax=Punica granatum TaxID=22663 RepID=A0A218XCF2_PUNGR|nr:fra a 1-associated protein [Punica granatum]OWM82604.1 hypothetical protein CDL15_Pgr002179 [Punica granatum]PKI35283.1 hypothetical protein CRG98_044297 [Punica granatum]